MRPLPKLKHVIPHIAIISYSNVGRSVVGICNPNSCILSIYNAFQNRFVYRNAIPIIINVGIANPNDESDDFARNI